MTIYTEFKCKCKINNKYNKCIKELIHNHAWNNDDDTFVIEWKNFLKNQYLVILHNYHNKSIQTYWPLKHDNIDLNEYYLEYKNYPPFSELNSKDGYKSNCIYNEDTYIWEFNGKILNYQNQVEAFHDIILLNICDEIIIWDIKDEVIL
jgi:hypothetical protein